MRTRIIHALSLTVTATTACMFAQTLGSQPPAAASIATFRLGGAGESGS